MLRAPSRRKRKDPPQRLNLIPILDAVFIFIFFLLMSANFIKIFEVQSDVPIISNAPPSKKKPLALTVKVYNSGFNIYKGVPSSLIKKIDKDSNGDYNYESLHGYMIDLKKNYKDERSIVLEPKVDVEYEVIVKIMDAVRLLRSTDDAIYQKNEKTNEDIKVKYLFDKIVFGNIRS